jgi:hypothetical protein
METRFLLALLLLAASAVGCGAMPNPPAPSSPAPYVAPAPKPAPADPPAPAAQDQKPVATPAKPAAPPAPSTNGAKPIARVAGKDIDVSELLNLWLHQDSLQVLESLDHLVLGRLVLAEAGRLGVQVDPERTEKAYQDAVAAIEKTLTAKHPGVTLDRYVDEALGLDPVRYREYLRDESLRGLLAERAVRTWVLESERAEIRVIVVKSEEDSRKVSDALAAGEAFAEVAKRLSADGSAKDGGGVPPVVKGDTPIARLAFQTEVGKVGGPQYEKSTWLFVKVEARPEPLKGDWKDVSAAVEKSLSERPVADLEVSQWKPVMVARYGVDVSPLLEMAGQRSR